MSSVSRTLEIEATTASADTQADHTSGAVAAHGRRTLRVGLFGCPLDTGNRGVSALGFSTIDALAGGSRALDLTMFDFGDGTRYLTLPAARGDVRVRQVGCFHSRRYHRLNNLSQMRLAARLRLRQLHPMLRRLDGLDAILDVSGGDSFSDIYGTHRFTAVTLPKLLAMEMGLPLILLPQTYGPYASPKARATAAKILQGATQAWARDAASLVIARDLLGEKFDPSRHRCGVDMAFGLRIERPADAELLQQISAWRSSGDLVVGLNVSGMLFESEQDVKRFGFIDSYTDTVRELLRQLLRRPGVRIMLVPHVTAKNDPHTGDAAANEMLVRDLSPAERERVLLVPGTLGPMELKWVVGQCDWFCGTRMHACIAALSQGVPSTSIAYSDKTAGVFATAGVQDGVVDPRVSRGPQIVEQTLQGLDRRDQTAAALRDRLPALREQLAAQHRVILESIGN